MTSENRARDYLALLKRPVHRCHNNQISILKNDLRTNKLSILARKYTQVSQRLLATIDLVKLNKVTAAMKMKIAIIIMDEASK